MAAKKSSPRLAATTPLPQPESPKFEDREGSPPLPLLRTTGIVSMEESPSVSSTTPPSSPEIKREASSSPPPPRRTKIVLKDKSPSASPPHISRPRRTRTIVPKKNSGPSRPFRRRVKSTPKKKESPPAPPASPEVTSTDSSPQLPPRRQTRIVVKNTGSLPLSTSPLEVTISEGSSQLPPGHQARIVLADNRKRKRDDTNDENDDAQHDSSSATPSEPMASSYVATPPLHAAPPSSAALLTNAVSDASRGPVNNTTTTCAAATQDRKNPPKNRFKICRMEKNPARMALANLFLKKATEFIDAEIALRELILAGKSHGFHPLNRIAVADTGINIPAADMAKIAACTAMIENNLPLQKIFDSDVEIAYVRSVRSGTCFLEELAAALSEMKDAVLKAKKEQMKKTEKESRARKTAFKKDGQKKVAGKPYGKAMGKKSPLSQAWNAEDITLEERMLAGGEVTWEEYMEYMGNGQGEEEMEG